MVYECEKCGKPLPSGVLSCPKCGDAFDEAVPPDAEVPARGWQPKPNTAVASPPNLEPQVNTPVIPGFANVQEQKPAPSQPQIALPDNKLQSAPPVFDYHQATDTPKPKRTSWGLIFLAIVCWPVTIVYFAYRILVKVFSDPVVSANAKALFTGKVPAFNKLIKVGWWVLLGFLCIASLLAGSQGNMTGFWLLLICGGPTVWLMRQWSVRTKLAFAVSWVVFATGFGIYCLTPSGKAAYAATQHEVIMQKQQAAQAQKTEEAKAAAEQAKQAKTQAKQAKQAKAQAAEQARHDKAQAVADAK